MMDKKLTLKMRLWLQYYLDPSDPKTFGNASAAARAAGYRCSSRISYDNVGAANLKRLSPHIEKWFDEAGLSEVRLKEKLLLLLNAKETKFFQHAGMITDQVEVKALGIQRQALEMAMKMRGMYGKDNQQKYDSTMLAALLGALPVEYANQVRAALLKRIKK